MDVVFWAVLHVPAVVLVDFFWRERVVVDLAIDAVEVFPLVRENAEEGAAALTGSS